MLALIPARGGSKRLPRKNLREVAGKPLIAHTIAQANQVEAFDKVVVSTEDEEIATVARDYDGDVPFSRPEELAADDASSEAVVTHTLDWFENLGMEFDTVCLLQVTTPLRRVSDIRGAIERFQAADAKSLVTVTEFATPPQFALTQAEDGTLEEYFEPSQVFSDGYIRSQDIDPLVFANGAVYLSDTDVWRREERFFTSETIGYEMPPDRSIDIDDLWELKVVECLLDRTR